MIEVGKMMAGLWGNKKEIAYALSKKIHFKCTKQKKKKLFRLQKYGRWKIDARNRQNYPFLKSEATFLSENNERHSTSLVLNLDHYKHNVSKIVSCG